MKNIERTSKESDEALVERVQSGDVQLYGELVIRYEERLKRYGRKFLQRTEDIEDIVQDIFIKGFTHIQSFDTKKKFSSWIYRIAHNAFINEMRTSKRIILSDFFEFDTLFPHIRSRESADDSALQQDMRDQIESMLSRLSVKYREVIILRFIEDLSYKEIADILKIPSQTVGARISRAKKEMRTIYKEMYE